MGAEWLMAMHPGSEERETRKVRRREEEQEFGERHCRQAGWDHPDLKTMDSEMRPIPPKRLIELTRERERGTHTLRVASSKDCGRHQMFWPTLQGSLPNSKITADYESYGTRCTGLVPVKRP